MTIAITNLSFVTWFDPKTKTWTARARELPLNLGTTAATPGEAITALVAHVEDLLSFIDNKPRSGLVTEVHWQQVMIDAKVTPNAVREAIKSKSLAVLRDTAEVERVARQQYHLHHHTAFDYQSVGTEQTVSLRNPLDVDDRYERESGYFVDGFKRGVSAALKADL